jgi:hypothetical protein
MGYSHTIQNLEALNNQEISMIEKETIQVFESLKSANHCGLKVFHEDAETTYRISKMKKVFQRYTEKNGNFDYYINFNGAEYEEGCETFSLNLSGEGDVACVKTSRKAYDIYVCAFLLIIFKHCHCKYEIYSDGDYDNWMSTINTLKRVSGLTYRIPF